MAGIPYYTITPCCPDQGGQITFFHVPNYSGNGSKVFVYNGTPITINGITFETGFCYTISRQGSVFSSYPDSPDISEFTQVEFCNDIACAGCEPALPIAYEFVPCCGGPNIRFLKVPGTTNKFDTYGLPGTYKYIGASPLAGDGGSLEPGACYTINEISGSNVTYPYLPELVIENDVYGPTVNCNNPELCPVCAPKQYTLYPCDPTGIVFCTENDLSAYVGTFVTSEKLSGCYFVKENEPGDTCDNPVDYEPDPAGICNCELRCYTVTGNPSSVTYVNADLEIITVAGNNKFCSYIAPIVTGGVEGSVYDLGLCINEQCPAQCYKLINCQSTEVITVSNSEVLTNYYLNNNVVTLMGYEGCWIIDTTEECDCAVDVSVLQVFNDCPSCLPIVAYKFINCTNSLQIKYSTEDFSDYVGKVVQLDCGDCWIVEQIDYTPPNVQLVTIDFTFDSCLACERTYYKLTDCQGIEDSVYTYTDLANQVGKVIKIQNCNTCWEVEETRLIETVSVVKLISEYNVCLDCLLDQPCLCSRITNQYSITKSFQYLDCLAVEQTITLAAGETSDKVCLFNWMLDPEVELVYIEYFGDCVNNQCPVEPLPKRKVKPGYSVPACDIDKYEKITCKASEVYYKQVMRLRYGISNCCPEDEEKWLVKKELIDLQALRDPNYICTPVSSCCQENDTCGCGCNSQLKTCNS